MLKHTKLFINFIILLLICTFSFAYADNLQVKASLQTMLDREVIEDFNTPGAVLLVTSPSLGTIIIASGYSDLKDLTPMTIHNNFRVASITKTFVAVTVLKLVQQGKLQLSEKIDQLLPPSIDLNQLPNSHEVTLHDLLGMRSGIPNYVDYDAFWDVVRNKPQHSWTPQEIVATIYGTDPSFPADKGYEYSNTNYVLLQLIIERLTGQNYSVEIHKNILEPLGLIHTYVEGDGSEAAKQNKLTTHGYYDYKGKLLDVTDINDGLGLGDCGLVTTAPDLAKFVKALLENQTLLPKPLLEQMLTVQGDEDYGLGIYHVTVAGEFAWTHNGSSSGFLTQYYYFPKRQLIIVILTNSVSSESLPDIARGAVKIIQRVETNQTVKSPALSGSNI